MTNTFLVVKEDGVYYPMRFITPNDEAGKYRAESYKTKGDEEIVEVKFEELTK